MTEDVFITVNPKTGVTGTRIHFTRDCLYLGYEYIEVSKEEAVKKYDATRPCMICVLRSEQEKVLRERENVKQYLHHNETPKTLLRRSQIAPDPCSECGADLHVRDGHVCKDGEWR